MIAAQHDVETVVESAACAPLFGRERATATLLARLEQRDVKAAISQAKCRRQSGDAATEHKRAPPVRHARAPIQTEAASQSLRARGTLIRGPAIAPPRSSSRRSKSP